MPMDFNATALPQAASHHQQRAYVPVESQFKFRFSPTQIGNKRLCIRKWAWQKIDRLTTETTPKQQFGKDVHAEIEPWLTDAKMMSSRPAGLVAKQGVKAGFLPTPGKHLIVEGEPFEFPVPEVADDTCLVGILDVCEPPSLLCSHPLIVDHKTTTTKKWMKDEATLRQDPQVVIYSEYIGRMFKSRFVLCRWIYYLASNPRSSSRKPIGCFKIEFLIDRESPEYQTEWARILDDARELRRHKIEIKTALDLDPDPTGCQAFGGCDFIDRCQLSGPEIVAGYVDQWILEHQHLSQCDSSAILNTNQKLRPKDQIMTLFEDLDKMGDNANPLAQSDATPAEAGGLFAGDAAPGTPPAEAAPAAAATGTTLPATATTPVTGATLPAAATADTPFLAQLQAMEAQGGGDGVNPPEAGAVPPEEAAPTGPQVDAVVTTAVVTTVDGSITEDTLDEMGKTALIDLAKKLGVKTNSRSKVETLKKGILVAEAARVESLKVVTAQHGPADKIAETTSVAAPIVTNIANTITGEASTGNGTGLVVIFDGVFVKNESFANGVYHLIDILRPVMDFVAKENNVEHWGLVEFAKGGPILQEKFRRYLESKKLEGVILANSSTAECRAVRDVLVERADVVIQGTR